MAKYNYIIGDRLQLVDPVFGRNKGDLATFVGYYENNRGSGMIDVQFDQEYDNGTLTKGVFAHRFEVIKSEDMPDYIIPAVSAYRRYDSYSEALKVAKAHVGDSENNTEATIYKAVSRLTQKVIKNIVVDVRNYR